MGGSVASAGDVNKDGFDDVIIGVTGGAEGFYSPHPREGYAVVYYGSATGLGNAPNWTSKDLGYKPYELREADVSVASAGDVNGDGFVDIIVGAPYYKTQNGPVGGAFVYFGSSTGLGDVANWIADSEQSGSLFGCSVAGAGDVNKDGFSDVIVGAAFYKTTYYPAGAAAVYYGSASGPSRSPDWKSFGVPFNYEYTEYGRTVSGAGDVNGDGFSDIIIGVSPRREDG